MMNNLLLIDDNPEILSANESFLLEEGFSVATADTGVKAVAALHEARYDCIVLDVLLPDLDGLSICKAARTITDAPIIFLTCMDNLEDKLNGLMTGGDDYMTKPYSLRELSARIKALIRRGEINRRAANSEFYIDAQNRMLHAPGKNIFLSEKEFEMFMLLYGNPGVIFSKMELYETIWKDDGKDAGTVAVHIMKLRRKIKFAESFIGQIENDYGHGYRLAPPNSR